MISFRKLNSNSHKNKSQKVDVYRTYIIFFKYCIYNFYKKKKLIIIILIDFQTLTKIIDS